MKQSEIAKWLKAISIAIAIMGIFFFFLVVPILAGQMKTEYPEVAFLYWPGLCYGWLIAAGCYYILYQFWKVAKEIGNDNSFSLENCSSFVKMSRMALIMALIWFIGLLILSICKWMNPGILILMLLAIFISLVISILTAALSHLIRKAYEMKQENELTI